MDIDEEAEDIMTLVDDRSVPDRMSRHDAKEFYKQLISDLEMRLEGLDSDG